MSACAKTDRALDAKDWPRAWQHLPIGGVIPDGGTSSAYETGTWRTSRPLWNAAQCTHCLLCWIYCPDSAIIVEDGRMVAIAFDYCKGCGVCAYECPKEGVLAMVPDVPADNG
jgi:pyruvate ferredoxin oxidoreductase delta subunit